SGRECWLGGVGGRGVSGAPGDGSLGGGARGGGSPRGLPPPGGCVGGGGWGGGGSHPAVSNLPVGCSGWSVGLACSDGSRSVGRSGRRDRLVRWDRRALSRAGPAWSPDGGRGGHHGRHQLAGASGGDLVLADGLAAPPPTACRHRP